MDLRQLECFVAVARHRSFTRAGEALYLTQSAVSQQVRRMEDSLGLALLRRTSRGVELTAAGAELLDRAEAILAGVAEARAAMDAHAGTARGAVRACATTGDALGLPGALAAFHAEHPGIRIALRHGPADEVVDAVRRGSADLAVAALRAGSATSGLTVDDLRAEPLVALFAPGEAPPAPVAVWELRQRPFILAEPGTALRETVSAACMAAGFSPVPLFEVGDPATVRTLVAARLGVSLVPASWGGPEVAAVPLDAPPAHRASLVTRPEGLAPAAGLLRSHLLEALR